MTNRERIIAAISKVAKPFSSMRQIGVASGLIVADTDNNSAPLRVAQRAITKLIRDGLIEQHITSSKIDNRYELSPSGKAFAATNYSKVSPKRADQHAQAPR
jgi:hypothetical protein